MKGEKVMDFRAVDFNHFTFGKEGERKLFGSELMELARKEPQKYEGKRYKAVEYFVLDGSGKARPVALVREGSLIFPDCMSAYIASETTFEEIKPEPQPVSFNEARKAAIEGKRPTITLNGARLLYPQKEACRTALDTG
jgi:hypothetical protein